MLRRETRCPLRSMTVPETSLVSIGTDAGGEVVLPVDDEERSVPPRFREEVFDDICELAAARLESAALRRRRGVERPINHECASFDHAARHRPPETGVVRVIAIVSHRENLIGADGERAEVIARAI